MSEETSVLNALECSMTIHDMDKKIRDQVVVRPGAYYDDFEEPDSFGCCKHEVLFWLEKIYKLEIYLESSNKKEFFQLFFFIRENLMSIFNKQLSFGLELYYSISQMFLIYINRHENLRVKKEIQSNLVDLLVFNSNVLYDGVFDTFEKIARLVFQYQNDERKNNDHEFILILHEYIRNNVENDLSLDTLAEIVSLNPSYLSRTYKQVTGFNLSDFIFLSRIQKAKKLLKESNLKVHEIASMVGIESSTYFIRLFRKNVGLTPLEYREALIR